MLYLEALGNLQLGNVHSYLEPIIKANYSQNTDIRFLAILATMPTAHTRPDEVPIYIFFLKSIKISIQKSYFSRFLKHTGQYFTTKIHLFN